MFITQTNDFGSVICKIEQHICRSKKVTNFTPTPTPQIFDVETFWCNSKTSPKQRPFNNKKHYKCKNAILKQKNHHFFKFSKTYVSETGCHGNMINHMDMVIIPKCS